MALVYQYPGVYIEEVPSGVRPIIGVATSITAFIGWAPKGPTDAAYRVTSWADFERLYGGMDARSYLGYAVYHFYQNGGSQAYIVRLAADDAQLATATLGDLVLTATGPGEWGTNYRVAVRAGTGGVFGLDVIRVNPDDPNDRSVVESFENLSLQSTHPRFAELALNQDSQIVNATVNGVTDPTDDEQPLSGGADGTVLEPDGANSADFITAMNGNANNKGVPGLADVDLFNLLCVPGLTNRPALADLQKLCRDRRAFLITEAEKGANKATFNTTGLSGKDGINSALYFPWIKAPDPMMEGRVRLFPPSGFVAGLYAFTDASRGVWKAPAGTEASLTGAIGVETPLSDTECGLLNIQGVNCIRTFNPYGTVIWGARTLKGNDLEGSEWKYIPVRRTALFIEETLYRNLKWVVFEPNDEPLWASIRLNVGTFMQDLFRQHAFQGASPREAYFVKCDKDTTTQSDINRGIVNIRVGFAPLKPAEFVVVQIQQMAGQSAS
jgi:phage tail sheath protein FI